MTTLLADIGGTNTRCGLLTDAGDIHAVREFRNAGADSPQPLLECYLDELTEPRPTRGLLAVAAPVRSDSVQMINIDWSWSINDLTRALRLDSIRALNDFEALAWALPGFSGDDLVAVGEGAAEDRSPKVAIGPGTGLGVAALIPTDQGWQSVSGEGGHVTLAASDDREAEILARARARFGHCSAERLVSGPGIAVLHELAHGDGSANTERIAELAAEGNGPANETLDLFFRLLGTVAGDLAVTFGAFGGVYVGGGIVPRHLKRFSVSGFRDRFEAKGRYREYLAAIPTSVIVAEQPTLRGLAAWATRAGN